MIAFNRKLYLFIIPLVYFYVGSARALPQEVNQFLVNPDAVLLDELDKVRGRGGIIDITSIVNSNVEAELSNNTANNNFTGFNIIDKGSFSEASGVFSIIQNTGNNVIIQDSTIINVTISP
ncbi:hypothetical protein [Neptunomonas japonica]|uniref:hypothetical protein n=1 Tax=Neptunomonas japonica TaxID=417574 RepID=UPI00041717B8|nr:hypothetical protein [Neptunomonas japonica]